MPKVTAAQREAERRERILAYVARVVAEAPPLTPEQADKIASILRPPAPIEPIYTAISAEIDDCAASIAGPLELEVS